ncbi:4-hydroxy-tetrahydrodipicolinate synthase [Methylobacterium currus]|uniref:4-hydroxy-tetrahydrodipicolinate synthase n=1 Tax=Methylobacterium currus TaxID=2051553 RepID=A0A2R4WGP0_9HYPH|nr:4-hydroxy-tetrahydrodipicolinate synthase [Methylobacterium currus]AWB20706.1 4-hydroxy-tetrahydrodipicolinate synthase [Methylobacterium currus]UHC14544.1 4-hydroxy-tetrahydrodipicolinate synthase [Methylobacterium currus]
MTRAPALGGALTALVTPFAAGGTRLDERALGDLVAGQVAAGTEGLVVGGPTGEGPTLTEPERDRILRVVLAAAGGRIPVIAATDSNGTRTAIARTRAAEAAGAAATLAVTPFYNRPTQEGLSRHFAAIAAAADRPLLLHRVPARAGTDLLPETVARLAALPGIAGIVDATGDLASFSAIGRAAGPGFLLLSGDDATAAAHGAMGGQGCVSVVANLVPGPCAALQRAIRAGDHARARDIQAGLGPLIAALSLETDPGPVKLALALLHSRSAPDLRLPLVRPRPETEAALAAALARVDRTGEAA